jgi:hypothetical protein
MLYDILVRGCDDATDLDIGNRRAMSDEPGRTKDGVRDVRAQRLKSALRDNLKKRKAQARGRAGMTIVTPQDDARARDGGAAADGCADPEGGAA